MMLGIHGPGNDPQKAARDRAARLASKRARLADFNWRSQTKTAQREALAR